MNHEPLFQFRNHIKKLPIPAPRNTTINFLKRSVQQRQDIRQCLGTDNNRLIPGLARYIHEVRAFLPCDKHIDILDDLYDFFHFVGFCVIHVLCSVRSSFDKLTISIFEKIIDMENIRVSHMGCGNILAIVGSNADSDSFHIFYLLITDAIPLKIAAGANAGKVGQELIILHGFFTGSIRFLSDWDLLLQEGCRCRQ